MWTRTKRPPNRSLKIKTIRRIFFEHSKSKGMKYRLNRKSTPPATFVDISAFSNTWRFSMKVYVSVNYKIYPYHRISLKYILKWQNYAVSTNTTPIYQRSSVMQNWLQASCLRRINGPKPARFEPTGLSSGCKRTVPMNSGRSLRRLMNWKSFCRSSGKSCHKNISTKRWQSSPSAWLPTWVRLPLVVTSSICSLQVCILISSSINELFSQPPTDNWWRQYSKRGAQHNCVISDIFQQKRGEKVSILWFHSTV